MGCWPFAAPGGIDFLRLYVTVCTEARIQEALDEIRRDRTAFIAHRFSTLRVAGCIVVIGDGWIVGQGTHESLIESNPTYQRLWRRQWAD